MVQPGRSPRPQVTFRVIWYDAEGFGHHLGKTSNLHVMRAIKVRDAYVAMAAVLGVTDVFLVFNGRFYSATGQFPVLPI